jgi:Ca2+/Na+ antiporter
MKVFLKTVPETISFISSVISIASAVYSIISNYYGILFYISIILGITCIVIFIYFNLKYRKSRKQIAEQERKIAELDTIRTVPIFMDILLTYTQLWRNDLLNKNNGFTLSRVYVDRIFTHNNEYVDQNMCDNHVTYLFEGTTNVKELKCIKFIVSGAGQCSLDDINFEVRDTITGKSLLYHADENRQDCNSKLIDIYFNTPLKFHDIFSIKISWLWRKTVNLTKDYFLYPNLFGSSTNSIEFTIQFPKDFTNDRVGLYELAIGDKSATFKQFLTKEISNDKIIFNTKIVDPKHNADYIIYYE